MPRFYSLQTPGAPTFTAKSASLNLSGRDEFALSIDPDVMDREWYHSQDYYPHNPLHGHSPLSPADDVLTTVGFSYPSHTVPASDALAGMSSPSLYRRRLLLFPQFFFFRAPFAQCDSRTMAQVRQPCLRPATLDPGGVGCCRLQSPSSRRASQ